MPLRSGSCTGLSGWRRQSLSSYELFTGHPACRSNRSHERRMSATPAMTIVLPFRDAAATLAECLGSIQGQSWTDYEVLAIDDGSQDTSAAIVRQWAETDRRIR